MTAPVCHHHHGRDGQPVSDDQWRELRTQSDYCIIGEYRRATEVIQAVWHSDADHYDFTLRIVGGKHHGIDIHCATEKSVMRLFDATVAARKADTEPFWLTRVVDDSACNGDQS